MGSPFRRNSSPNFRAHHAGTAILEFDTKVSKLKLVRDETAQRLNLDPGVLCARERLELVVRKHPTQVEALAEIPELRRWQIDVLGPALIAALH